MSCYVAMGTTKYRSVTEQIWNDGFHINWPTGDKGGTSVVNRVVPTMC